MVIIPNIGHTEGQFKAAYYIEPYKGITVDFRHPEGSKALFAKTAAPVKEERSTLLKAAPKVTANPLSKG